MGFDSVFRKRIEKNGLTPYDRKLALKAKSFQKWFDSTLTRSLVFIDGVEQYAVFQDQNMNNNKDLSDDKYIVVENTSNMEVGSLIKWRNKNWLVFSEEAKTIPTHKQAKVKESNGFIKWMIGDQVSGHGLGHPAYIQNQTLYTLGVSTSGNNSWIVNAKMTMYLPKNAETSSIKVGQRVVIGGMVYQVMFKDDVSREGLINYLMEQDFINLERDNMELGIADYYTGLATDTVEEPTGSAYEVVINGADKAKIGSLVKYDASVFQNGNPTDIGISEWTIADTEAIATVAEQTTDHISIRIVNNFQKVGNTITVIGKTADGVIGSKTVRIVSPY